MPGDVRLLSTAGTTRLVDVSFSLEIEVHMTEVFAINPRVAVPLLIASPCCSAAIPLPLPTPAPPPALAPVVPASTPLLSGAGTTQGYGSV